MRTIADKGPKEQLADIAGAIALGVSPRDCIVALKRVIDRLPDEDQWRDLGWDEEQQIREEQHREAMDEAHRGEIEDRLRRSPEALGDDWARGLFGL